MLDHSCSADVAVDEPLGIKNYVKLLYIQLYM